MWAIILQVVLKRKVQFHHLTLTSFTNPRLELSSVRQSLSLDAIPDNSDIQEFLKPTLLPVLLKRGPLSPAHIAACVQSVIFNCIFLIFTTILLSFLIPSKYQISGLS